MVSIKQEVSELRGYKMVSDDRFIAMVKSDTSTETTQTRLD